VGFISTSKQFVMRSEAPSRRGGAFSSLRATGSWSPWEDHRALTRSPRFMAPPPLTMVAMENFS